MKRQLAALLLSLLTLQAQDGTPPASTDHEQLRQVRTDIIEAIESRNVDQMLKFVHPEIVVTWQDGQSSQGIAELRAFYDRAGKDAFVGFKVPHQPDDLSVIHAGDTAISKGYVVANYHLIGRDLEFKSRWTATLVKQDGKWLVAGYHVSLNALDNPILSAAKSALWIAGGVGLAIGGIMILILKRRRRI
jgi:ketosteroid isomerase-like protein